MLGKKIMLGLAAIASAATSIVPMTAASAQRWDNGYYGGRQSYDRSYYADRGSDRRYYRSDYRRGGYDRGNRGRYRCDNGTGGTIIGAIAGGLLGNEVAGRGDRTLGAVLGAGAGALAGRAIDRGNC